MIKAKRNGYKPYDVFKLGKTKGLLKKYLGNLEMELRGSVITKSMTKNKDHSLLWHNLINLPDSLNKPSAIFKSTSLGFVVLTDIIDYRDKPVMAAIHFNEKSEILHVRSMYARRRYKTYQDWAKSGYLLYANKKCDFARHLATIAKSETKPHSSNKYSKKTEENIKNTHKKKNNLSGVAPQPVTEAEPVVVNRFAVDIAPAKEDQVTQSATTDQEGTSSQDKPNLEEVSLLFTPITEELESNNEKIEIQGDLGGFLGYVERYEYAILLRGEKGAGKTRLLYQLMNTFAKAGFTVGSFSLEIGKRSNLVKDMRNTYLSPLIADKVMIAESCPNGIDDIRMAAKHFDVICVDSWGKIPGVKSNDFDKLRKEFPQTMFIIIFQSTTNGTARGGSQTEYDAGIVIQVANGGRAYCEKNRYNGEDLTYLVFDRKLEETKTIEKAA